MADNTILYGKWYFNESIDYANVPTTNLNFTFKINEEIKNGIKIGIYSGTELFTYYLEGESWIFPYPNEWDDESYRTIVITRGGSDIFLTWLQANATKVSDSIDVEGLKTNKMIFKENINELTDIINNLADSSGSKIITEVVETAKTIVKPSGILNINDNGNYNVKEYKNVEVNVPIGIIPEGTKSINANGNYDVEKYKNVEVNVNLEGATTLKALLDYTKSMSRMFYQNQSIIDLTGFINYSDTSNVENMAYMCNGCSSLKTIPDMDTSNVTDLKQAFISTNLTGSISLNLPKCRSLQSTFQKNYSLKEAHLVTSSELTDTGQTFYSDGSLITVTGIDMLNVATAGQMFYNCSKLTNLTLTNIKINLTIGSGSTYGHLLTIESLLNCCQECINVNASRKLTIGSANITKLSTVYVKLTNEPEADSTLPKLPMVQCESTDEGAMLVADYMALKNWSLA